MLVDYFRKLYAIIGGANNCFVSSFSILPSLLACDFLLFLSVMEGCLHLRFSFLLFTCQTLVSRLGWPHTTRWTVFPLHQFSRRDYVIWVLFLSRVLNWPLPTTPPTPPHSGWKPSRGRRRTAGLSSVQGRTFQQGMARAASGKWAELLCSDFI